MKHIYLLLAFVLSSFAIHAQQMLPKGFAPGEQRSFTGLPEVPAAPDVFYSAPQGSDIRTAAEWEEIQALFVTWTSYPTVLKEIVRAARLEVPVYIICGSTCSGSSDSGSVKTYLTNNGVSLSNVKFMHAPCNSVWIRDYGPNSVYKAGVDSLVMVDWKYNRPTRVKDDTIPRSIGRRFNVPVHELSESPNILIGTGGNWMSDGFGNGFGSELILDENPSLTTAQVDQLSNDWMGISRFTHMETLPYDGIHHIDMHMKLLDEETLLVGEYPQGMADGPQIEANIQYVLSNFYSVYGTPYKVIRIPMPPDQNNGYTYPNTSGNYLTYANATIINKTVIIPQFYAQYDTVALRIWKQAMPGYKIVGINSNSTISASGSLHCITHSLGVQDPLHIAHKALSNTTNTTDPYEVNAYIRHRSGINSATIYYRTDTTQPYLSTPMTFSNGFDWTGSIPAQPAGTTVYYYIHAEAVSGKMQNRPMPAPQAYWSFKVDAVTSLDESSSLTIHKVYPNPSHGLTCINLEITSGSEVTASLKDILGREVLEIYKGQLAPGEKNLFFDSTSIPAGVYLVDVNANGVHSVQKVVVK